MNYTGAIFSPDRKYRYVLWRCWKLNPKMIQFIGLNPSTANEMKNDNTIKRLIRITQHNGFDGFFMTNLFGLISTDPDLLLNHPDPVGENDQHLRDIAGKVAQVVFCWGNFKQSKKRAEEVMKLFPEAWCIDKNIDGSPKHPLLQPSRSKFRIFKIVRSD